MQILVYWGTALTPAYRTWSVIGGSRQTGMPINQAQWLLGRVLLGRPFFQLPFSLYKLEGSPLIIEHLLPVCSWWFWRPKNTITSLLCGLRGLLVRKLPGEIIKRNGFPPQILHSLSAWINVSLSKPLTNSHVSSGRWITLLKLCKSYDGSVVNWRKYLLSKISSSVVLFWSILISFDWLLLFGKYLTFSFSYLSLRVSLTQMTHAVRAGPHCSQEPVTQS